MVNEHGAEPGDLADVMGRLRKEAARCEILSEAGQPDPTLDVLLTGFAREIASLRGELRDSLERNRRNLLSQFLGLGVRRQPAQALVACATNAPFSVDQNLDLRGASRLGGAARPQRFRCPGSVRLPHLTLAVVAYTGPGGLFLSPSTSPSSVRSNPLAFAGEFADPGPPCLHIGLRGVPPRRDEVLSLAVVPPEESRSRLAASGPELLSYRRWLEEGTFFTGGGEVLPPPRRLCDLAGTDTLADVVSDRLPTARAAFRGLLRRHLYADLVLAWAGPLDDVLVAGPPPETLRRAVEILASGDREEWPGDLRWMTLRLPRLPGGDPGGLIKRVAINVIPVVAYRRSDSPESMPVTDANIHPTTGMLPVPLSEETHLLLQGDDWVVDHVECGGETYPHIHEHPDPEGNWYGLVSDRRSSALYLHPARQSVSLDGRVFLYLGRLVGDEANDSTVDPLPYDHRNQAVREVTAVVDFVGGGSAAGVSEEAAWEGIGSFLRTRDRLITKWDYVNFIQRFDPRIVHCSFSSAALPREARYVPGILVTVHFEQELHLDSRTMGVSVAALAREVELRATMGTHVDIELGSPMPGTGIRS